MKKYCFLTFLFLITWNGNSQTNYEDGYFIDNGGVKTNVLIKNEDWKNNPVEFEYKKDLNSETLIKTVNEVREFGIKNRVRYISVIAQIDRSSEKVRRLNTS